MDGVPDVCPPGSNYIAGGPGGDFILGTNGDDCIFTFGGDDFILSRGGDDYICAGDGADTIFSGGGGDSVFGQGGDDFVNAGGGSDDVDGGDGNDNLNGSGGGDTINGGSGNDTLNGGGGNDSLSGGNGNDTLDGGGGTNACVEEVPGSSQGLTSCANITYVTLSDFDAVRTRDGVSLTWETSTEVGTVSFRLWRRSPDGALQWVGEVAAAPEGTPQGASYFLRDEAAPSNGPVEYIIEERTVSGGSVQYGPFVGSPRLAHAREAGLRMRVSQGRVPRRVALRHLSRPLGTQPTRAFARKSGKPATDAVLVVDGPGVIEVDAATIAETFETSADTAATLIRSGNLHLRLLGESVAWHAVGDGAALRFVAPELRSPFSAHHRYLLSLGLGQRMETAGFIERVTSEPHEYLGTTRLEENLFPGPTGGPDPRQDLFFWHALAPDAQVTIPVALPGLSGATAQELRVYIHGATEHPEQPHRVELHWNGQSLGTFDTVGRQRHTISVSLDGVPTAADNELIVKQHVAGEAPPVVYVDAVEVDYARLAETDAPAFRFDGSEDGEHSIRGLTTETADLYDVTDPRAPRHYGAVALDQFGGLSFSTPGSALRFLAAGPESISAPIEVTPRFATDLRSTHHEVDYLIVAATHLVSDAQALADLREADGYRVLVVDIEDVYWEFANGEPDPLAIRDFLGFANTEWEAAPRFATLIGKGNLDYRDLMGLGGNWIPSPLAETDGGLFPSDSMLGDVSGLDGVPEIAIGRLPITTAEELTRIIDAIRTFEADHGSLPALFAADDSSRAEFEAASDALAQWSIPARTQMLDLNTEALDAARERLFSLWQGGLGWVSYVGHGGVDRLASEGLLTSEDAPDLAAMPSAPVVLGWSCNLTRFDIPGYFSLGEELVIGGSSAGVFGATGWSNHVDADALRSAFTEAVFASDAETIGEAMIQAHQAARGAPVPLHRVYLLLGDPALRLREAKALPNPLPAPSPDPEVPGEPAGGPRVGDDLLDSGSGCEIASPGARRGPVGPGMLLVSLVWAIRRRRA